MWTATLREWSARLRGALGHGRRNQNPDEELRSHLDLAADAARHSGTSNDANTRSAMMRAGRGAHAMYEMRDRRGLPWLDDAARDLTYAARLLRRNPGFTAVALLALALGIGVNTTVFTAYKAMVARGLDARAPREMVNLALMRPSGTTSFLFSHPDYESYRDAVRAFSGLVAFAVERPTLSDTGGAAVQRTSPADSGLGRLGLLPTTGNVEYASAFMVSENYFAVLGVPALRGRTFDAIAARDLLASPPALIAENYWQRRFAGDPAMIGRIVHLNGVAVTIVGITPHDFMGTGAAVPDFWLPLSIAPLLHGDDTWLRNRDNERLRLFARLAPGVTMAQAQAEMNAAADRIRALHKPQSEASQPATAMVWPGSPFPLPLEVYGGLKLSILLIMVAAGMVLVVACANVASLQLARARWRRDELHTRLALGASRARVVRQLLTESALLGGIGGGAALLVSWTFLKFAIRQAAAALPVEFGTLVFDVAPDAATFAYVCAISFLAAMLFGLAPALESSRTALVSTLRPGTAPSRSRTLQDGFLAAQVALSLVLLVAGSMLIRSAIRSLRADPGYDRSHIVVVDFRFPEGARYSAPRKNAITTELHARLAALPGVTVVASGRAPSDDVFRTPVRSAEATSSADGSVRSIVRYGFVGVGYFDALGIPLVLGRGFGSADAVAGAAVISESTARLLWPGENPVGRRLRLGPTDERFGLGQNTDADGPAYQVIGVARNARGVQFDGSDSRIVYLPLTLERVPTRPLLVRSASDPVDVMRAIDPVIAAIDPALLVTTSTIDDRLRQSAPFLIATIAAAVASTVGLIGLLLAAMGIYGTVSYIVALRTREVGIRIAVGADSRDILALILRESTRPVAAGLVAGLALGGAAAYLLRGVLFGLNNVDVASFVGVSCVLLAVAWLAAFPPARRALRVDPAVALRYE